MQNFTGFPNMSSLGRDRARIFSNFSYDHVVLYISAPAGARRRKACGNCYTWWVPRQKWPRNDWDKWKIPNHEWSLDDYSNSYLNSSKIDNSLKRFTYISQENSSNIINISIYIGWRYARAFVLPFDSYCSNLNENLFGNVSKYQ